MIRIVFRAVLLLIQLFAGCLCLTAQENETATRIREIMQQHKVIGLSVAVVKKGKLVYNESFGMKNVESNTVLTNDCLFRIASISKSFSATSIMQLAEAKKLSVDDDISDLIGFRVRNPKFPDDVITLGMMLSHTSSLNDSQGYFTLDAINPAKNPDWAKCYSEYRPGSGYMYCNLNYNIIGTVIEKTSGERFDRYVKRHILDPLQLYGGYCVDSLDSTRFTTLYEYNADSAKFIASPAAYAPRREQIAQYVMGYSTPIFSPTGGMKITSGDLARYMTLHINKGKYNGKKIMSKKSARLMQSRIAEKEGYGFAIETTDKLIPGKTLKGHTGSAYGLFSAMYFQPDEKFGIVVITNGCDPGYTEGYNTAIRETVNCLYDRLIKRNE